MSNSDNSNEVLKKPALDRLVERIFSHLKINYFSRHGGTIDGDVDINGTLTADDIYSNGGVSAKGIADFGTPSGTGGTGGISVLRDDEVANVTSENVTDVASAYAVKKIRDIINIDDIEEFSEEKDYGRGNLVRRGDRLYRFFYDHSKGAWASGDVEPVNITTLSTPLSITENDLMNILK